MTREEILQAFDDINFVYNDCTRYDTLKRMLEELTEHKRGEWIQHVNEPSLWSCSICETVIYSEHDEDRLKFHKWCGCCGADMRGDDDEQSKTGTP